MENKLVIQTVYLPVDVNKRLPKKNIGYFTYQEDDFNGEKIAQSLDAQMFENGIFEVEDKRHAQPSHWLEKKENQIVINFDYFKQIIKDAIVLLGSDGISPDGIQKIYDTYIDNLLNEKVGS